MVRLYTTGHRSHTRLHMHSQIQAIYLNLFTCFWEVEGVTRESNVGEPNMHTEKIRNFYMPFKFRQAFFDYALYNCIP